MPDDHAEVPGPSDFTSQGNYGCNAYPFSSDQLCELENVYCRGQYNDDEATMVQVLALLEVSPTDFSGITDHVIQAWFKKRQADSVASAPLAAQAPASAVTATTQPGPDTALQQSGAQHMRLHNPQQFGRDKAALFAFMEAYNTKQPGANVLVLTTSAGSLGMWADGRGPLLNVDSVLKNIVDYAAGALRDAAEQRARGTLDFNSNPGQRHKRETACKGSGYLHFQAATRQEEKDKLVAAGKQVIKGMVEQQCSSAWRELSREVQQDYHRISRQHNHQREQQTGSLSLAVQGEAVLFFSAV